MRNLGRTLLLLTATALPAAANRALVRAVHSPLAPVLVSAPTIGPAPLLTRVLPLVGTAPSLQSGLLSSVPSLAAPMPALPVVAPVAAAPAPAPAAPVAVAAAASDAPVPEMPSGRAALDALNAGLTSAPSDSGSARKALDGSFDGVSRPAVPVSREPVHHWESEQGTLSVVPRRHDPRDGDQAESFRIPPELADLVPSARQRNPDDWTKRISFHLHSVYSDGTLQPEEVVARAAAKGVKVLALTDHDTVAGIAAARAKARELGLEFHAGVELSAGGGVHINAVGVDETNPKLLALIERVRAQRLIRAQTIVEHLNARFERSTDPRERAVRMTVEEVKAKSMHDQGGTIEIPHVARVLIDKGLISRVDEAYRTYLTPNVLTDPRVPDSPEVEEVLEAVHAAGGKAFLNHPYTVRGANQAERDAKVQAVLDKGLDGIEVYRHSRARSESGKRALDSRTAKYLRWALERGLLIGNGADYHGSDTSLSSLIVWMPKALADKLEKALAGLRGLLAGR